jgi:N6-adenosine-specific RNA methylase IME4
MKRYRTILADPPWSYRDKLRIDPDIARSSTDHYPTMTLQEICDLAVADPIYGDTIVDFGLKDDAFLFLWTTNSFLVENKAQRVCEEWGFTPKQLITWVKTKGEWVEDCEHALTLEEGSRAREKLKDPAKGLQFGMGFYTRGVTEHIILATRGRCTDYVKDHSIRNVIFAPRIAHSRKPQAQYDLIEQLVPGPYLELFATRRREGWDSWGLGLGGDQK